ncbi:hypothetical protein B0H17DRAFT_1334491 [Mycena rosella]|uniref:Hemerythrin-like domain-containing protein n=1 Tax=Mycena rosella TaxID=1033263 RepID=A0AAD7D322_MYCRO|nr:hypothetical protein B0H17DRAFT_1334491 [Mycena rosella]
MAFPTDLYERLQASMGHAHDTYRFAYQTIFPHLDSPPVEDLDNFLGYVRAWASSIGGFHDAEEAVLLPFLNQKLDFSAELEQHVAEFEAAKLKTMMEALHDPLSVHLSEEVDDLAPDNFKVLTTNELDMIAYFINHSEKFVTLPFMRLKLRP